MPCASLGMTILSARFPLDSARPNGPFHGALALAVNWSGPADPGQLAQVSWSGPRHADDPRTRPPAAPRSPTPGSRCATRKLTTEGKRSGRLKTTSTTYADGSQDSIAANAWALVHAVHQSPEEAKSLAAKELRCIGFTSPLTEA